jgi:phosphoribosylformimino-5-aminoimidazole carboxamide ribotide isomerase
MILFPAIDLKDGQAVRLLRGEMTAATVFNDDPAAQGMAFVAAGAEWLHLVDLDGAFAGEPRNARAVESILAACRVPAQLGGGIRDRATVERWLGAGIARVILGTAAVEDPGFVRQVARAYPGQVAVGLDARGERVATRGWASETEATVTDLARAYEDAGIAALIYTDIARDGAMQGPNVEATAALARAVSIPVIASGGVSSLHDLAAQGHGGRSRAPSWGRALTTGRWTCARRSAPGALTHALAGDRRHPGGRGAVDLRLLRPPARRREGRLDPPRGAACALHRALAARRPDHPARHVLYLGDWQRRGGMEDGPAVAAPTTGAAEPTASTCATMPPLLKALKPWRPHYIRRAEAIGQPLGPVLFAMLDAIHVKDPRLQEIRGWAVA